MLSAAAFLFFLVSSTTVQQLETEQETSIAGIFQKEGLRLFVEDCLKDSLEEGLVKVGEGGRIWHDTTELEGALAFSEDYNGINYENNLYYLGLTNDLNFEFQEAYPCEEYLDEPYVYCKYIHEDSADFGHKEGLTKTSIASDLEKFVKNNTLDCVQEFLSSELSYSGDLGEGELTLNLDIQTDGINIDAKYPLELTVEGETYFHLTEFDYFYPSSFQTFLLKAVTTPLTKEQGDVNFNWTEEELIGNGRNSYSLLSPTLTVTEVEETTEGLGHRVINYQLDAGHILENDPYSFSFAIQNRPPSLDYIQREACTDYDFTIIPDSNREFESINISAIAYDPDQDEITFEYYPEDAIDESSFFEWIQINDDVEYVSNISANIPEEFVDNDLFGIYEVRINATDTHGLSDWQDVRVLIDRPLEIKLDIVNAYTQISPNPVNSIYAYPTISTEDPFYISVVTPEDSAAGDVTQEVKLIYTDPEHIGDFEYVLPGGLDLENCFSFPWKAESGAACSLDSYSEAELLAWKELIETPLPYSHMSYSGDADAALGLIGTMEVVVSANYCSTFTQKDSVTQNVNVVECISYDNPEHKWAYPYHKSTYDEATGEYIHEDEDVNPFEASHSCCENFVHKEAGEICYESPDGCYGQIPGKTEGKKGYVLENIFDKCSGERGNICGTLDEDGQSLTQDHQLATLIMTCGFNGQNDCTNIEPECQGVNSWDTVDGEIWCHGTMGCENVCRKSENNFPIYIGNDPNFVGTISSNPNGFASIAYINGFQEDSDLIVECGTCSGRDSNEPCDLNYNGQFDGVCSNGACVSN